MASRRPARASRLKGGELGRCWERVFPGPAATATFDGCCMAWRLGLRSQALWHGREDGDGRCGVVRPSRGGSGAAATTAAAWRQPDGQNSR